MCFIMSAKSKIAATTISARPRTVGDRMTYANPNKGLTKQALENALEKTLTEHIIGYYVAQYGAGWPIDTLFESREPICRGASACL